MAWPKGKPRKMAKVEQSSAVPVPISVEDAPQAAQDAPSATIAPGLDFDLGDLRRRICAHRVRRQPIPRDLRVHDYLPLAKVADMVRRDMAKDGAEDSQVEAYVAARITTGKDAHAVHQ